MTDTRNLMRLSIIGLAVVSMAACASRPKPEDNMGGSTTPPPVNQPTYPTAPSGDVGGGALPGTARPGTEQDFIVNTGDRVYFDLDSHEVKASAFARLDAQADWLRRYPNVRVRIEGNADERGTREYNLALGARRAESVRTYLVSRGVPAARIDTISYGKERPIAAGSNEEAWARNRNAHTAIVSGAVR